MKWRLVSQEAGWSWQLFYRPNCQFYHVPKSLQTFYVLSETRQRWWCKLNKYDKRFSQVGIMWIKVFVTKEIWLKLCKIINLFTFFSFEKKYLYLRWRLESTPFMFIIELSSPIYEVDVWFTKSLATMPPKNNPSPSKSNSRGISVVLVLPKIHLQVCLYVS